MLIARTWREMIATWPKPSAAIKYPDSMGYNTTAGSLFEAASKASNGVRSLAASSAPRAAFATIKYWIGVGMVPDRWYRARVGRVGQWVRERGKL